MWDIHTQSVPSGLRMQVVGGDGQLSFREFFFLLETNADFAHWYSDTLVDCPFDAFFWEFPPFTTATFEDNAEFVLIKSAALSGLRPDPVPFESQFSLKQGADVITFPNLGGDALLIVPTQLGSIEAYPHLATFLSAAPGNQIRALWQAAANAVTKNLSDTPRWLSTAGLGVSWLHLRLDTRPKYYNYSPYKVVG